MKCVEEVFTKEGLEELAAFKRELNESIIYSEGKDEGLQEGLQKGLKKGLQKGSYNNQKETTFKLLKKNFPQEDLSCFHELNYAQYKVIFDMLIEDKEFDEIKAFIENDEEENYLLFYLSLINIQIYLYFFLPLFFRFKGLLCEKDINNVFKEILNIRQLNYHF